MVKYGVGSTIGVNNYGLDKVEALDGVKSYGYLTDGVLTVSPGDTIEIKYRTLDTTGGTAYLIDGDDANDRAVIHFDTDGDLGAYWWCSIDGGDVTSTHPNDLGTHILTGTLKAGVDRKIYYIGQRYSTFNREPMCIEYVKVNDVELDITWVDTQTVGGQTDSIDKYDSIYPSLNLAVAALPSTPEEDYTIELISDTEVTTSVDLPVNFNNKTLELDGNRFMVVCNVPSLYTIRDYTIGGVIKIRNIDFLCMQNLTSIRSVIYLFNAGSGEKHYYNNKFDLNDKISNAIYLSQHRNDDVYVHHNVIENGSTGADYGGIKVHTTGSRVTGNYYIDNNTIYDVKTGIVTGYDSNTNISNNFVSVVSSADDAIVGSYTTDNNNYTSDDSAKDSDKQNIENGRFFASVDKSKPQYLKQRSDSIFRGVSGTYTEYVDGETVDNDNVYIGAYEATESVKIKYAVGDTSAWNALATSGDFDSHYTTMELGAVALPSTFENDYVLESISDTNNDGDVNLPTSRINGFELDVNGKGFTYYSDVPYYDFRDYVIGGKTKIHDFYFKATVDKGADYQSFIIVNTGTEYGEKEYYNNVFDNNGKVSNGIMMYQHAISPIKIYNNIFKNGITSASFGGVRRYSTATGEYEISNNIMYNVRRAVYTSTVSPYMTLKNNFMYATENGIAGGTVIDGGGNYTNDDTAPNTDNRNTKIGNFFATIDPTHDDYLKQRNDSPYRGVVPEHTEYIDGELIDSDDVYIGAYKAVEPVKTKYAIGDTRIYDNYGETVGYYCNGSYNLTLHEQLLINVGDVIEFRYRQYTSGSTDYFFDYLTPATLYRNHAYVDNATQKIIAGNFTVKVDGVVSDDMPQDGDEHMIEFTCTTGGRYIYHIGGKHNFVNDFYGVVESVKVNGNELPLNTDNVLKVGGESGSQSDFDSHFTSLNLGVGALPTEFLNDYILESISDSDISTGMTLPTSTSGFKIDLDGNKKTVHSKHNNHDITLGSSSDDYEVSIHDYNISFDTTKVTDYAGFLHVEALNPSVNLYNNKLDGNGNRGTIVRWNSDGGTGLFNCYNNTISYAGRGIYIFKGAVDSFIINNTCFNNDEYGIRLLENGVHVLANNYCCGSSNSDIQLGVNTISSGGNITSDGTSPDISNRNVSSEGLFKHQWETVAEQNFSNSAIGDFNIAGTQDDDHKMELTDDGIHFVSVTSSPIISLQEPGYTFDDPNISKIRVTLTCSNYVKGEMKIESSGHVTSVNENGVFVHEVDYASNYLSTYRNGDDVELTIESVKIELLRNTFMPQRRGGLRVGVKSPLIEHTKYFNGYRMPRNGRNVFVGAYGNRGSNGSTMAASFGFGL